VLCRTLGQRSRAVRRGALLKLCVLWPLLVATSPAPTASPSYNNPRVIMDDWARIVAAEIPPYVQVERGEVVGSVALPVRKLARAMGLPDKIEILPWARAQQVVRDAATGHDRLIIPLTWSPQRDKDYTWIAEVQRDDLVLVTRAGVRPVLTSEKDALGLRVGMLRGSPGEADLAARSWPHLDPGTDERVNARKLKTGRIDAWLVARQVAPVAWSKEGYDPAELQYGMVIRTNHLWLAASKTMPASEAERWRKAWEKVKSAP
jgi:polar amino acid transport system substrate-binding protein